MGERLPLDILLGASGASILTTLIYEMKKRDVQYGLATMCIGVGQGISAIVENSNVIDRTPLFDFIPSKGSLVGK